MSKTTHSLKRNRVVKEEEDDSGLFIRKIPSKRQFRNTSNPTNAIQSLLPITPPPNVSEEEEEDEDDGNICEMTIASDKSIPNCISKERLKENLIASSALAINIFLESSTVMQYTLYWLSQYSNSAISNLYWFNDIIEGIISRPIEIGIISDMGYPSVNDRFVKYRYLFSFIATSLHSVPLRIFETQKNDALSEIFGTLIHPDNQCFLYADNGGLKGEVEVSLFKYNHILDYFFEPSFIILYCYSHYVSYLVHAAIDNIIRPRSNEVTKKKTYIALTNDLYEEFTPYIKRIRDAIDLNLMKQRKKRLGCFNKSNPFYEKNLLTFKQDMVQLKDVIDTHLHDLNKMKIAINQLLSDKASYCNSLQQERIEYLMNKGLLLYTLL